MPVKKLPSNTTHSYNLFIFYTETVQMSLPGIIFGFRDSIVSAVRSILGLFEPPVISVVSLFWLHIVF